MTINASAVTFTEFGPDFSKNLLLTQWQIDPETLGETEILLETLASPINPSDLAQLRGGYPSKPTPYTNLGNTEPLYVAGREAVFRVVRVGRSVTKYVAGDWLIPLLPTFGAWRTHGVADVEKDFPLIKVSSDDDPLLLDAAATLSINPPTAYQLLFYTITDWKSDGSEYVIQNAGNSQVAKYVTQIAKAFNINTISVVRDGKSQAEIDELYKLGATKVVSELDFFDPTFSSDTLPKLVGKGNVRLALNSVGGPTIEHLVKSLSHDGILATFGGISGGNISYSGGDQLYKNITTIAYWLTANTVKDPQTKVKTLDALHELYNKKQIVTADFSHVKVGGPANLLQKVLESIENSKKGKQVLEYK